MDEFNIFQNKLISAHLIWEFTKSYVENNKEQSFPNIILTMPVLPICLNKRATQTIKDRKLKEGSLIKVIDENKDIFSGLQQRMQSMARHTLESIYIAGATNLISLDKESLVLIPIKKSIPEKINKTLVKDYTDSLNASKRIGAWFSNMNLAEICLHFNIVF